MAVKTLQNRRLAFAFLFLCLANDILAIQFRPSLRPSLTFGIPKSLLNIRGGASSSSTSSSSLETTQPSSSPPSPSQECTYNQTTALVGSTNLTVLIHQLQTSPTTGLTSSQAQSHQNQYGKNILTSPPGKSLLQLILEQFDDKLVQILLVVAVVSGIFSFLEIQAHVKSTGESIHFLKGFMEPLIILAILVLNAAVGVWQSRQAEGSLEALKKLQPSLATVMRDGVWKDNINAAELVPGDLIMIRVGDKVCADARMVSLESSVISLDEGSLTGESVTTQKLPGDEGLCEDGAPVQDMQGVVFAGTVCTRGSGVGVVVRTGMETEIGKIQKGVTDAKEEEHKTPLGIKLDEFGEQLTAIISVICLVVWLVSFPKFNDPTFKNPLEGALYYAKVAVALGVAAIPEGLPAVITLCLSLGTRRMAKRNGKLGVVCFS
jgi:Ca2+-transporting ATPase